MDIIKLLQRAYRAYRRKKNWQRVVRAMAMVVVFCTTYALILPAITMESGTICGLTEHTHTDACYVAVTEPEAHTHTGECYEKSLVCTLDESEGHNHSDSCNGIIEKLICTADHEEHVGTCYSYENGLVCGLEESEGHSHGDACWESKLICGLEEAVEETTGATEETTGETEEAVKRELVCGLEEHTHDESCYPVTEPETTENISASVDADPEADLETQEDWEASLSGVSLTGDWSVDLLAIAASQLGYTESQSNYITDENGQTFHYTRYGQWYGAPYGDWSAMFVSFCLRYAQVEGIPADQDCQNLLNVLRDEEIYLEKGQYAPVPGDLIFLDKNADGVCDAVGIVEEIVAATEEAPEMVRFLAGDWEGRVERVTMEAQDVSVLGYAVLPTEPDDTQEHTFAGEDGMSAQVALDALTTAVPEDAVLTIEAVTEADEEYAAMTEQVEALVEKEILDITMLDISFYDAQGEYIGVGESASVSLTFPGDAFGGNAVKVFHFTEDGPTELTGVSYYYEYETAEDGTETMQTVLTFDTEGFSVFAVTEVYNEYSSIAITDPAELDGNAYYIVNGGLKYSMLDEAGGYNPVGLEKLAFNANDVGTSLESSTVWTFYMQEDGTFFIKSDGNRYLVMQDTGSDLASVTLTDVNDETKATAFTIRAINNQAEIGYDGPIGKAHYLNVYQGDKDFLGWKDSGDLGGDAGSRCYLYLAEGSSGSQQVVTGLGGEELAIVSNILYNNYNKAMYIQEVAVNNQSKGLTTSNVTLVTVDGAACVEGEAVLWMFEATARDGVYNIYTTVDGDKKYLRLLDSHEDTTPDGRGSLTLGDQAQDITVIANGDGTVSLYATVTTTVDGTDYTVTGYVNLDTSAYNYWTFNQNVASSKLLLCKKTNTDSSFAINYGNYVITVKLQDMGGNKLYTTREDKEIELTNTITFGETGFAPEIEDYEYSHAVYIPNNNQPITVSHAGPVENSSNYRIYDEKYDANDENVNRLYYTQSGNSEIVFVYKRNQVPLRYDLNLPSGNWVDVTPAIANNYHKFSLDGTQVHTVVGISVGDGYKYVVNSAGGSEEVVNYYKARNSALGDALTMDNYMAPGSEYVFLGWQATTTDGTFYFDPNAIGYATEDGTISMADSSGVTRSLPAEATLVGRWQKVNDLVQVFINHSNTMLSSEDTKTVQTDPSKYTDPIAIGRIYNSEKVNLAYTVASKVNHSAIANTLVTSYDATSTATQVVIDAIWLHGTTNAFVTIDGATAAQMNGYAMNYIQTNDDTSREIKIDGVAVERQDIEDGYYTLYWYSLKSESGDAWHMDGILAAETDPIEIRKTFSGLTSDQVATVLGTGETDDMKFQLYLIDSSGTAYAYRTLKANKSADEEGVFSYIGQEGTSNIYKWNLNAIQGQSYAFAEENYELDGYTCTSLISVHFKNSNQPVYKYNVTSTIQDNTIKEHFGNLDGAEVSRVIFANFYTPTGTGMFSISKISSVDESLRLPGAVFTLEKTDGSYNSGEITTNVYGSAHFSDLTPGTYTLKEVSAPANYQENTATWTVVVDETDGVVIVKIIDSAGNETSLYDSSNGGIQEVYPIANIPADNTLVVTAAFNLTGANVEALKDSYTITLTKSDNSDTRTLKLTDAEAKENVDGSYSWLLNDMTGTYTIVESGYSLPNFKDTVITASMNGTDLTATDVGTFQVTLSENTADAVTLTNTYINNFQLDLTKVGESETTLLSGAQFGVYALDRSEAPDGEPYVYTDATGTHTAYRLPETLTTDADGFATYSGLKLGATYVLVETQAPAGYVMLEAPILIEGTTTAAAYNNGIYAVTVKNTSKANMKVDITANVAWDVPWELKDCPAVNLILYRSNGTTAEPVGDPVTVSRNNSDVWTYTWTDQAYADGNNADYTYFVAQETLDGYSTTYDELASLKVGTNQITVAKATGTNATRSVTITNTSGYALPETGGAGTRWMAPLGLMLILAAAAMYWLGIEKKKQGGVDSS